MVVAAWQIEGRTLANGEETTHEFVVLAREAGSREAAVNEALKGLVRLAPPADKMLIEVLEATPLGKVLE